MRAKSSAAYVLITVFIAAFPFLWPLIPAAANALGNGTDDKARNAIRDVAPHYVPWFDAIWRPSSPDMERILFTMQALLGALIFIGVLHALRQRSGREK
jgi:cobalt/nickel transport protein